MDLNLGSRCPYTCIRYQCVISDDGRGVQEMYVNPVLVADGLTYERAAILSWLSQHGTVSPVTGETLQHTRLIPDWSMETAVRVSRERKASK